MNRRWKSLIFVGIVLGVAILAAVIRHYQLRAEVTHYIAKLKAEGEPMELAQVIPPPVPADQNDADTLRKAAALFEADTSLLQTNYVYGMEMVAPGKAMICSEQAVAVDAYGTNSWENVCAAVAGNKKPFALLQQIIGKPRLDFHVKYDRGVAGLDYTNLYLVESKQMAQRLETAALCDLHQGDTAKAVENLRAMLAIVKGMRDERLVISELVRIAIADIALTVNWEVLQSTNVTDQQLADLQGDWASLDFIRGGEYAFELERVTGGITLKRLF